MTMDIDNLPQGSVALPDGMFYLTVNPEDTTHPFFLGIYPESGPERHVYKGSDVAAAIAAFKAAEQEYPNVKFPKRYLDSINFLSGVLGTAVSIDVALTDGFYCDGCYDFSQDTLSGYFYPALPEGSNSVKVNLHTSCYTTQTHEGSVQDGVLDDVATMLARVLDDSLDDDVRAEVQAFADVVNAQRNS